MPVPELAQIVTLEREMASNPATPFGIEFGHVQDVHGTSQEVSRLRAAYAHGSVRSLPRSGFSRVSEPEQPTDESPFAALSARKGRPLKIGILSDFIRIPYANGAAFQTRLLYQQLRQCGHQVTVIGPHDPDASPGDIAPGSIAIPSIPLKTYPGVHMPVPSEAWVWDAERFDFDLLYAPVTTFFLEFGIWLRKMKGIPLLCVNTTHLQAAYEVLLPEKLSNIEAVHSMLRLTLGGPQERACAALYNQTDGLMVLSEGLRDYWRERGVTVPIHVIPRTVQPEVFDKPIGEDPYLSAPTAAHGPRLLCAGRHTREKGQDRLVRIFARYIAKAEPTATLTLLGEGPDTRYLKRLAEQEGVADRVHFPGEVSFTHMADYYAHADLFTHVSLSETFGNVLGEALWCGTPTVAFADGMGASSQIKDGVNGVLMSPGAARSGHADADRAYAEKVIELLHKPEERARLGKAASRIARERSSPIAVQRKLAAAFQHVQDHAAACGLRPMRQGPKVLQWLATFKHFQSWSTVHAALYLAGYLRPNAAPSTKTKANLHPQIAK
jgi:1,2-diacylglycerol 3-alpha-glucosyltransferase